MPIDSEHKLVVSRKHLRWCAILAHIPHLYPDLPNKRMSRWKNTRKNTSPDLNNAVLVSSNKQRGEVSIELDVTNCGTVLIRETKRKLTRSSILPCPNETISEATLVNTQ
jgi:hypothetical protein